MEANKKRREWEEHNGLWVNDKLIQPAIPYITPPVLPAKLAVMPIPTERKQWQIEFRKHAIEAQRKRARELKTMASNNYCLVRPLNGTVFF